MLNELIKIEKKVKGKNCLSNDTWIKNISCWACREKIVTTENFNGHGYDMIIESTYKIRNTPKVENLDTRDCRIVHKGKTYDIKSITSYDPNNEFLKIECKMVN